jgi:ankyrin repeat protein
MACERGRLGAVEALIQNSCDFDAVDAQGENALHVSMRESKLEIIRSLLTETGINAEAVNVKGRNPLVKHFMQF